METQAEKAETQTDRLKRLKPRQTVKESVYFEYDRIGTLVYILYFHLIGHTSSLCVDVW